LSVKRERENARKICYIDDIHAGAAASAVVAHDLDFSFAQKI
jgi:hypothetical protein